MNFSNSGCENPSLKSPYNSPFLVYKSCLSCLACGCTTLKSLIILVCPALIMLIRRMQPFSGLLNLQREQPFCYCFVSYNCEYFLTVSRRLFVSHVQFWWWWSVPAVVWWLWRQFSHVLSHTTHYNCAQRRVAMSKMHCTGTYVTAPLDGGYVHINAWCRMKIAAKLSQVK
jgi:hypothetical protein